MRPVEVNYPLLRFDLRHDDFVVWLRWVSLEQPPSPAEPTAQGMRASCSSTATPARSAIVYRRELEQAPVYLRRNRARVVSAQAASGRGLVDVQSSSTDRARTLRTRRCST